MPVKFAEVLHIGSEYGGPQYPKCYPDFHVIPFAGDNNLGVNFSETPDPSG